MRGFNKMILAELQTQEQNHEIIAEALIDALRAEMLKLGFNALMNIRVDDIYTKALSKKYRTITRQAERRIYAYLAGERRYSDVKILYGDDDINF